MALRALKYRTGVALGALLVVGTAGSAIADPFLLSVSGDPTTATDFGLAVASGDLNADGRPDLVVGAPRADVGGVDRGRVEVFFGGVATDTIPDLVFHGVTDGELFGDALAADGDLNGDGIDDLVVAAPYAPNGGTQRGRVAVYYGSAAIDSVADLDLSVLALLDGSHLGTDLAYVGDTNGDGFEDLLVGASDAGPGAAGFAYLFLGDPDPESLPQQAFQGEVAADDFGCAVGGNGDVNGDGFADLLVGAQDADFGGGDSGAAYLFLGGSPVPDATYDLRMPGVGTGDDFGFTVSAGGDVNGDGYDDWIVGAVENTGAPGYVKLYFGAETSALDAVADLTFTGYTIDAWYGRWAELADLNGDGYADVVVSAIFAPGGTPRGGQVYGYFGGETPDNGLDVRLDSPGTYTSTGEFGCSLDIVDDLDGDGLPEIAIGEHLADAGHDGIAEGRAYIVTPVLGRFAPVQTDPGVSTPVTLELAEGLAWGETRLFWRVGGSAAFDSTTMSGTGDEPRTAAIPGGIVGRRGVQFWSRTAGPPSPGFAYRSPPSGYGSVDVRLSGDTVVQLEPERFEMIGLSVRAADPRPAAVFDELGPYDPTRWRYGVYDGSAYAEGASAPGARPGQGFWIISRDAATIRVNGTSADLSTDGHTFPLRPGWNQIGNPFGFEIALPADLPPGVIGNLSRWNGTRYESFLTSLEPGRGYWIRNESGSPQELTISAREAGTSGAPAPPPHPLREGEGGWSLAVDAFVDAWADEDQRFGMRDGATDAVDPLDLADLPSPPSGYVQASFLSEAGAPLMVDTRAPFAEGARWQLVLRSDLRGRAFTMRIRNTPDLPAGWSLVAADRTGGIVRDLRRDPEMVGTVPSDGSPLAWHILAGTASWIERAAGEIEAEYGRSIRELSLAIGPNPLPHGAVAGIVLSIPAAGPVDVSIHDVTGRLVRRLAQGPADRGVLRLQWNGTDRSGRAVGSGVYFLRAESGGFLVTGKIARLR